MTVWAALVLLAAQDGAPLILERTFGDDRWLASPRAFEAVALSPDARRLAAASTDTRVQIWDLETRRLLHEVTFGEPARVVDLLLPDAATLLTSQADGFLRVWSLAAPDRPTAEHRIPARSRLAPSPVAGEVFVATSRVDWRSGETTLRLKPPTEPFALVAGPERIFTGHAAEIIVWDPRTGGLVERRPFDRAFGRARSLALDAEGKRLLSGHGSGRLLEWAPESRVILEPPAARPKEVVACAWPAVAVHASGELRSGDAKRYLPLFGVAAAAVAGGRLAMAEAVVKSPGIAEVLPGWNHPGPWSIVLWDPAAGRRWRPEGGAHDGPVLEAAARGGRLVTRSLDAIVLWDAAKGVALAKIEDEPGAFALDATRLLTSSAGGLRVWDLESGRRTSEIAAPVGFVWLGGRRALVARGEEVECWDLESGKKESVIAAGGPVDGLRAHAEPGLAVLALSRGFATVDVEKRAIVARAAEGLVDTVTFDARRAALAAPVDGGYELRILETATGAVRARQTLTAAPTDLRLDGPVLWVLLAGNRVTRWTWETGGLDERILSRPVGALLPLDGRRILAASGSEIYAVDVETDRWSAPASGHRGAVVGLIALDKAVLSFGMDRTARLWRRP